MLVAPVTDSSVRFQSFTSEIARQSPSDSVSWLVGYNPAYGATVGISTLASGPDAGGDVAGVCRIPLPCAGIVARTQPERRQSRSDRAPRGDRPRRFQGGLQRP